MIDAAQGGIAFVDSFTAEQVTVAANTAAGTQQIFQNAYDESALLLQLRAINGAAGNKEFRFQVSERNSTGVSLRVAEVTLAGGAQAATKTLLGDLAPSSLWVPPDWQFLFSHDGTGAGDTLTVNFLRLRVPRGFRPW